jgi:hypothetical protein
MIGNEKSECGIILLNCFVYDIKLKRKYLPGINIIKNYH